MAEEHKHEHKSEHSHGHDHGHSHDHDHKSRFKDPAHAAEFDRRGLSDAQPVDSQLIER
jgi:hypothetical protein